MSDKVCKTCRHWAANKQRELHHKTNRWDIAFWEAANERIKQNNSSGVCRRFPKAILTVNDHTCGEWSAPT
jgi:hypothetical protein